MEASAATGSTGRSGTQADAADADASILTSKITVPGLPAWAVPRPRLERLIDGGVRGPLTALIGPPGIGKTLAMAAWATGQLRGPVAWVTLDEFDNRPRVQWGHVTAALRRADVPVPHTPRAAARARTPHGRRPWTAWTTRSSSGSHRRSPRRSRRSSLSWTTSIS